MTKQMYCYTMFLYTAQLITGEQQFPINVRMPVILPLMYFSLQHTITVQTTDTIATLSQKLQESLAKKYKHSSTCSCAAHMHAQAAHALNMASTLSWSYKDTLDNSQTMGSLIKKGFQPSQEMLTVQIKKTH